VSRQQFWMKALVVYTLVICMGPLFAYAEFRSCGGDAFSAVALSLPGTQSSQWSPPSVMTWQQSMRWGAPDTYDEIARFTLTFSYGRKSTAVPDQLPSTFIDPSVASGAIWYTRRFTSVGPRYTLCIDAVSTLSNRAFDSHYAHTIAGVVRDIKTPPHLSLSSMLRSRTIWIPELVVYSYTIFPGGAAASEINSLAALVLGLPGWLILPLLILAPSWLVLPVFWLLVTLGIFYVVLPQRAWGWMKARVTRLWTTARNRA